MGLFHTRFSFLSMIIGIIVGMLLSLFFPLISLSARKWWMMMPSSTTPISSRSPNRAASYLKAFPEPGEGMKRYVIYPDETDVKPGMKIGISVGKEVIRNDCNGTFLTGKIEEKELQGYSYRYFEVTRHADGMGSSMMWCPTAPYKVFTTIPSDVLTPYLENAPAVVYVPSDLEVRYRLWSQSEETFSAVKF